MQTSVLYFVAVPLNVAFNKCSKTIRTYWHYWRLALNVSATVQPLEYPGSELQLQSPSLRAIFQPKCVSV